MALDKLVDAIASQGWYVWDDFLSYQQVKQLKNCTTDQWQRARIGRNEDVQRASDIRRDKIQWLDLSMGQPIQDYLERMEVIRREVNRHLYLGLFEYEAHFAQYEVGDFYKKHLDAFRGNESRKLTTVFYMNDGWCDEQGGQLQLYAMDDSLIETIAPLSGRLLVFLSEQFPHEVLPTNAQRSSIAGWFRVNGVSEDRIDILS